MSDELDRHGNAKKPTTGKEPWRGAGVWDDEALEARPYVQWLRAQIAAGEAGAGPPPDHQPVADPPDVKPFPPAPERPEPVEGQCGFCLEIKPLPVHVWGKRSCSPCAMEGVDKQRLREVLREERRPPGAEGRVREVKSESAKPKRKGNRPWTSGEGAA